MKNLRAEEIEKSIRKKFHKRLFSRFAKQFGNMSWCRRGTGLQSVFPVEKIRADGKAVSGIKKAQQVSV